MTVFLTLLALSHREENGWKNSLDASSAIEEVLEAASGDLASLNGQAVDDCITGLAEAGTCWASRP